MTWNLTGSCGQQQTLWVVSYGDKTIPRWRSAAIWKSIYRHIAVKKIIGFSWNFAYSSRFWTGWTSRGQKWKSCIGQTPSSTERISCWVWYHWLHNISVTHPSYITRKWNPEKKINNRICTLFYLKQARWSIILVSLKLNSYKLAVRVLQAGSVGGPVISEAWFREHPVEIVLLGKSNAWHGAGRIPRKRW